MHYAIAYKPCWFILHAPYCHCCPLELKAVSKAMPTSKVSPWTESLRTWQLIDLGCYPAILLQLQHKNYVACQKLSLFSQTVEICEIKRPPKI